MPDTNTPASENHTPSTPPVTNAVFHASEDRSKKFRSRFFSFHGRIGRLAFFLRVLAVFCCLVGLYVLDILLLRSLRWYDSAGLIVSLIFSAFILIWTVLSLVSVLSLTARRLHDFDFSGKWIFPLIICIVLAFVIRFDLGFMLFWLLSLTVMLVLLALPGTKGKNRFGFNGVKSMLAEFD